MLGKIYFSSWFWRVLGSQDEEGMDSWLFVWHAGNSMDSDSVLGSKSRCQSLVTWLKTKSREQGQNQWPSSNV